MLNLTAALEGTPIPLETLDDLEALYLFLGTYLRWTRKRPALRTTPAHAQTQPQSPTKEAKAKPTFGGQNPPIGQRVIDYAERLLKEHPEGLTAIQLSSKMAEAGWQTRSENPRRIVHLRLNEFPDMFLRTESGKWVLINGTKPQPEPEDVQESLILANAS